MTSIATKQAHTPGPWEWTHDAEPYSSQWTLSPGVLMVDGQDGTPGGDEIHRANARLIAAAPDLLAAVKDARSMLATVEVVDGEDGDPWSKALARMDAAIAKATGSEA